MKGVSAETRSAVKSEVAILENSIVAMNKPGVEYVTVTGAQNKHVRKTLV